MLRAGRCVAAVSLFWVERAHQDAAWKRGGLCAASRALGVTARTPRSGVRGQACCPQMISTMLHHAAPPTLWPTLRSRASAWAARRVRMRSSGTPGLRASTGRLCGSRRHRLSRRGAPARQVSQTPGAVFLLTVPPSLLWQLCQLLFCGALPCLVQPRCMVGTLPQATCPPPVPCRGLPAVPPYVRWLGAAGALR